MISSSQSLKLHDRLGFRAINSNQTVNDKLLCRQTEPSKRLGSGPDGAAQVKRHPWFSRLDWAALEARTLRAPMVPTITDPLDTSNFDEFDDVDTSPQPMNGPDRNAAHWEGLWDWVNQPVKRMNSSRKYVRSLSRREQMRAESTVPGTLDEHSSDEED